MRCASADLGADEREHDSRRGTRTPLHEPALLGLTARGGLLDTRPPDPKPGPINRGVALLALAHVSDFGPLSLAPLEDREARAVHAAQRV
jgi:hypothetical protein